MIVRTVKDKENPYYIKNRAAPNDRRLSWKAKGIHDYLMSKPDSWEANIADLANMAADGESAVRSGINELIKLGYMRRVRVTSPDGKIKSWRLDTYETPTLNDEFTRILQPDRVFPHVEKPHVEKPHVENRDHNIYRDPISIDPMSIDHSNYPPPPLDLGASNGGGGGPAPHRTHPSHYHSNTNGHHPTHPGLPPQPADHLAMRTLALALIADNLPAWNNPAAHVATRGATDLHNLLAWLCLLDRIRQAETASPYSVEAYYDAGAVDEYRAAIHGVRDLAAFVISRTGGGASPQHQAPKLCDADAAALAAAICAIESEANCESDPHD